VSGATNFSIQRTKVTTIADGVDGGMDNDIVALMVSLRETIQAETIFGYIHTCETVDEWEILGHNCPTNTAIPIRLGKLGEFFECVKTCWNKKLLGKPKAGSDICVQLSPKTVHDQRKLIGVDRFGQKI
jgi:hypothetical protein